MEKKSGTLAADDPTVEEQALDFAATRTDVFDDAVTLGGVSASGSNSGDVTLPGKPKRK